MGAPPPLPVSPFRENYYVPPTNNTGGKRWAIGGVGAAILGVRLLLLCGRLSSDDSDFSSSYNPVTFPTYDPNAFAALFDASLANSFSPSAQHIVVGADGKAFWLDGAQVRAQVPDGEVESVGEAVPEAFTPAFGSALILTDKSLLWTANGDPDKFATDAIVAMPKTGGAPKIIVKDIDTPTGLISDGQNLWFTEPASGEGSGDGRDLMRVGVSGGTPVKVASWTARFELYETRQLAVNSTNIYFVGTLHDKEDDSIKSQHIDRVAKSGGKPQPIVTLPSGQTIETLIASDKSVYFTVSAGVGFSAEATELYRVPAGGGALTKIWANSLADGAIGDVVFDGKDVFVSHRAGSVWSISRVTDDTTTDLVGGLAREPHFGLTRDRIVWSTGIEISSQSKTTTVP